MIGWAGLVLAAASAVTPAQDVADVSTRICYGLTSGTVALPGLADPNGVQATQAGIEALGLGFGLDKVSLDDLGPGGAALVSGSTMGTRVNGVARTVLTIGERGCRVLLVGDEDAALSDKVAAALLAAGWKAGPPAQQQSPAAVRRMFLRRDAAGKPYLLNLQTLNAASGRLRLFTSVAAIPPQVALPPGY
jgi:hypothetical protein